jgi:glycosyltransferase involved in cell wall biosynthesis
MQVDSATEWRGGQVQLAHLMEGLESRGHEVALAACPEGELARRLGRDVLPIPAGVGLRGATALRAHHRRVRPDLVVAQTSHAHSLCLLAGLTPVVHRRVDFAVGGTPWGRWKYRRAALFVAVSEGVARVLRRGGVPPERIRVVADGVRPLGESPPAPDLCGPGPLVGAVGALVDHKGHRVLLEAVAELPELRCVIAGEGPLREDLERRIRELGLEGRVRLLGQRHDVSAVLAALDLLAHPSLEEGMGQAVVEAMAAGVPLLVSDAGGLPEVVGPLCAPVPAGDPGALAQALRDRIAAPWDTEAARVRARERFSVDAMVDGSIAAYLEVVGA